MPYIPQKDRPRFYNAMYAIRDQVELTSGPTFSRWLDRFGYVYFEVNRKAMPALRYWALAEESGGVMHNIPDEMRRRLGLLEKKPPLKKFPVLDTAIDELVVVIKKVADEYNNVAKPSGSYPGAYAGLVNYALSTVGLLLGIDVYTGTQGNHAAKKRVLKKFLNDLIKKAKDLAERYYLEIAGPYEDVQIENQEKNGDLPEYVSVLEILGH